MFNAIHVVSASRLQDELVENETEWTGKKKDNYTCQP
jgi:hypothetical protein